MHTWHYYYYYYYYYYYPPFGNKTAEVFIEDPDILMEGPIGQSREVATIRVPDTKVALGHNREVHLGKVLVRFLGRDTQ